MTDNKDLLLLPLFQGINAKEINDVRDNGYLVNSHVKKGLSIISEGDKSDGLVFIVKGSVTCITKSDDNSYDMEETLHAPLVIEPEHLFGVSQMYSSTYLAQTICDTIKISKASVIAMMEKSMIFRINVLNTLSSISQKRNNQLWHQQSEEITHRIVRFIKDHCFYPAGHKLLRIKMNAFARELGCSRIEISNALHELADKELLIMHRGAVEIPMLQLLLKAY